jgi:opacity protein-like surface antigen
MKKAILFALSAVLLSTTVQAQKRRTTTVRKAPVRTTASYGGSAFNKGTTFLDIGVGLGSYRHSNAFPLGLALDHGITPNFSLGIQADFYRFRTDFGRYRYTYTQIPIALRGAYHITSLGNSRADVYLGAALGYVFSRYTTDAPNGFRYVERDNDISRPYLGVFIGGRYLLSEQVGLMAELGYGISVGKIGITFKL